MVVVYSRDASLIYTGGGAKTSGVFSSEEKTPDVLPLRRIHKGSVKHLQKDGTFKVTNERERDNWRLNQPVCLGPEGDLYTFPGPYSWAGWLVRVSFAEEGR